MAGFREFTAGEPLTATNVDDFLMKQSVMKFADSAARDLALGTAVVSPNALREGMIAYLDDTDEVIKYDGSAWSEVGGKLVEVKFVAKTDTFSASVAAGAHTVVTGLTISHAVADAANEVFLIASLSGAHTDLNVVSGSLSAGGVLLNIGDADGSRTRIASNNAGPYGDLPQTVSILASHTPGSTASVTYAVEVSAVRGGTTTVVVNRSDNDTNNNYVARSASTLMLLEVKG